MTGAIVAIVPDLPPVLSSLLLGVVLLPGTSLLLPQTTATVPVGGTDHVLHRQSLGVAAEAELVVTLTVRCNACAWDVEGREAVVLSVGVDNERPVLLPVTNASHDQYRLLLGRSAPGERLLTVALSQHLTAPALKSRDAAVVEAVEVAQIMPGQPDYEPLSLAPFIYPRPDTIGRFTDVPLLMWYEVESTPRGRRYRYSVVFSNEDGGTPADRLMATWGRTTDIEYLYSVEVNGRGEILHDDMQAPNHEIRPYRGSRVQGRHPELWIVTNNNMVLDRGATSGRHAPAPIHFPLAGMSREVVMDAHPWLYEVMAKELVREGKIVADAPPGHGVIPDPRRFAYLEGCGTVGDNALAFAVRVGEQWISSDRGVAEYRIARDGCFRAAVPLPAAHDVDDIRALRVQAFARPDKPLNTPVRFSRLNTLFGLDDRYTPRPSRLSWNGAVDLHPGGPPFELPVR